MKKTDKLMAIRGIVNLKPSFSSPLFTKPKTNEAKMSITTRNATAKYVINLTETLIFVKENGRFVVVVCTSGKLSKIFVNTSFFCENFVFSFQVSV